MAIENLIQNPAQTLGQKEIYDLLNYNLSKLKPKEKEIFELRSEGKTLEQIGKRFYISKERVRQLYNKSRYKLNWLFRRQGISDIKDYLDYIK